MTIRQVVSSTDQTLDQTSDTLVGSMTDTPPAGDYLVVFSGYLENGGTAKNYEFSIYVGGSIVQHTERACKIEGSIAATAVMSCVATHAWVTVNGSQAIEIRYRRTAGTTASTMKRRRMTLFPKASSDFQQATATANATISATSDTQLNSMTLTPGAGTYLLLFSTSADNAAAGISVFYSVYVNSVQVAHSEREFWAEASISANLGAMPVLIACVVTPTAGQVVEIRARRVTNNWTNYERTLTLMKVDAADIKEASATADATGTGTAYEDIGGTPLRVTDPGAADWLTIFSSSKRYGTIGVHETTNVSIFNAGSQVTDSELLQTHNSSIDNADYAIFTHGKITVAGATDDVEVKWLGDTATSRTMKERTLVMVREAATAQTVAVGQVTETDAAQAMSWNPKRRLIGQVTQSNLAQAITWAPKNRLISAPTETDTAQAVSSSKQKAVGQVTETDAANAVAWAPKNRLISATTEADVANAVTSAKAAAVVQAAETDTAGAITAAKQATLGQVTETDAAGALTSSKALAVGQVVETDSTFAVSSAKTAAVGQVTETDEAQPVSFAGTKIVAVGQVTETDAAQAVTWSPKVRQPGQVTETDLAQSITSLKTLAVGQVAETDQAQATTWDPKARLVSAALETDQAQGLTSLHTVAVGQVVEADVAQAVTSSKTVTVATAFETDEAQTITAAGAITVELGLAGETDEAGIITVGLVAPKAKFGRHPPRGLSRRQLEGLEDKWLNREWLRHPTIDVPEPKPDTPSPATYEAFGLSLLGLASDSEVSYSLSVEGTTQLGLALSDDGAELSIEPPTVDNNEVNLDAASDVSTTLFHEGTSEIGFTTRSNVERDLYLERPFTQDEIDALLRARLKT